MSDPKKDPPNFFSRQSQLQIKITTSLINDNITMVREDAHKKKFSGRTTKSFFYQLKK